MTLSINLLLISDSVLWNHQNSRWLNYRGIRGYVSPTNLHPQRIKSFLLYKSTKFCPNKLSNPRKFTQRIWMILQCFKDAMCQQHTFLLHVLLFDVKQKYYQATNKQVDVIGGSTAAFGKFCSPVQPSIGWNAVSRASYQLLSRSWHTNCDCRLFRWTHLQIGLVVGRSTGDAYSSYRNRARSRRDRSTGDAYSS
jgi:hypothetical protein